MEIQKEWITNELPEVELQNISAFAKDIATDDRDGRRIIMAGLKTSQLRKFYGEVKRIQAKGISKDKMAFKMLKPKLAYAAGRNRNSKLIRLQKELDKALSFIDVDNSPEEADYRFNNFVQIFEAIVAYHKYHNGND